MLDLVRKLRKDIDCSGCQSEKCCCNNISEDFRIELEGPTAVSMFGKEMKSMIENGQLKKIDHYRFALVDKCPLLVDGKCKLHDHKEELEMTFCLEFPIYVSKTTDEDGKLGEFLILDYRCPEVEEGFDKIREKVMNLPVLVVYHDGSVQKLVLNEFDKIRSGLSQQRLGN